MTTTFNHTTNLYASVLQKGHWASFIDYVWGNNGIESTNGHKSPQDWRNSVKGQESERLIELFGGNLIVMYETAERYFKQLGQDNSDDCLRCNRHFIGNGQDTDCDICGWHYFTNIEFTENVLQKMVEVNRKLNIRNLYCQLEFVKLNDILNNQHKVNEFIEEECIRTNVLIKEMESEVAQLQNEITKNAQDRFNLEREHNGLQAEIEVLIRKKKNRESLFKKYKPLGHSHILVIRREQNCLIATVRHNINFPADLIMSLMPVSVREQPIIKNAECFIILQKEEWLAAGPCTWRFELASFDSKVPAGMYRAECSYLETGEQNGIIQFTSNKLTFSQ